jgi:hypothetical protein
VAVDLILRLEKGGDTLSNPVGLDKCCPEISQHLSCFEPARRFDNSEYGEGALAILDSRLKAPGAPIERSPHGQRGGKPRAGIMLLGTLDGLRRSTVSVVPPRRISMNMGLPLICCANFAPGTRVRLRELTRPLQAC